MQYPPERISSFQLCFFWILEWAKMTALASSGVLKRTCPSASPSKMSTYTAGDTSERTSYTVQTIQVNTLNHQNHILSLTNPEKNGEKTYCRSWQFTKFLLWIQKQYLDELSARQWLTVSDLDDDSTLKLWAKGSFLLSDGCFVRI